MSKEWASFQAVSLLPLGTERGGLGGRGGGGGSKARADNKEKNK